jgi:hypothetical protein
MVNSIVDVVRLPRVGGWVELEDPSGFEVTLRDADGPIQGAQVTFGSRRQDMPNRRAYGFEIIVPRTVSYQDVHTGRVTVWWSGPDHEAQVPVWAPVSAVVHYLTLPRAGRDHFLGWLSRVEPRVAHDLRSAGEVAGVVPGAVSPDGSALAGRDGYFFVYAGSNGLVEAYGADEDIAHSERWASLLGDRQSRAQRLGGEFRQVMIPEKPSVLPEHAQLGNTGPTSRWSGVLREAERVIPGSVVDVYSLMTGSLARESWFRRQDSHLTTSGALGVVRALIDSIDLDGASVGHIGMETKAIPPDLAGKFEELDGVRELVVLAAAASWNGARLDDPVLVESVDAKGRHIGTVRHWRSERAPIRKRVICFGNSFCERGSISTGLTWWFSRLFTEFRFVWSPDVDWEACETFRGDVVLGQSIERFLGRLPAS